MSEPEHRPAIKPYNPLPMTLGILVFAAVVLIAAPLIWERVQKHQEYRRSQGTLAQQLLDEAPHVRRSARAALMRLSTTERQALLPFLVRQYEHEQRAEVRGDVVEAIAAMGLDVIGGVTPLVNALGDVDPGVRGTAAKALGERGPTAARQSTPALIQALEKESSREVTEEIISAVSRIGRPAVPLVLEALPQAGSKTRAGLIQALQRMGHAAAGSISSLRQWLDDQQPDIRRGALEVAAALALPAHEAVPIYRQAMTDADARIRARSADLLGAIGPGAEAALPELTRALDDPDVHVRDHAASAMERVTLPNARTATRRSEHDEETHRPLDQRLMSSRVIIAEAALSEFARLDPSLRRRYVPALVESLQDEKPAVRRQTVIVLGKAGADGAPGIAQAIEDDAWAVRFSAACLLGWLGPQAHDAAAALIQRLRQEPEGATVAAIRAALEKIGTPEATAALQAYEAAHPPPPLAQRLIDDDVWTHTVAMREFEVLEPKARQALVPFLIEALRDTPSQAKLRVMEALQRIGPAAESAVASLIALLNDADIEVRRAAIVTLRHVGWSRPETVPTLIQALGDAAVRQSAGEALLRFGDLVMTEGTVTTHLAVGSAQSEIALALIHALSDQRLQTGAFETLREADPQRLPHEAIPPLIAMLSDRRHPTRLYAATILGRIGSDASAALSALKRTMQDANPDVASAAAQAFASIYLPVMHPDIRAPIDQEQGVSRDDPVQTQKVLLAHLRSDPRNMASIVESLTRMGPDAVREAVPILLDTVQYGEEGAQTNALHALKTLGPAARDAIPMLLTIISTQGVMRAELAKEVLCAMGPAAVPSLMRIAKREPQASQPGIEMAAAVEQGAGLKPVAEQALGMDCLWQSGQGVALEAESTDLPYAVAQQLIARGATPQSDPRLRKAIDDHTRQSLSILIRQFREVPKRDPQQAPQLISLFRSIASGDPAAAQDLTPEFAEMLRQSPTDDTGRLLLAIATTALEQARVPAPALVPVVLEWLHDADEERRSRGVVLLGAIGAGNVEVLAALKEAASDSSSSVRAAAVEQIGRLAEQHRDLAERLRALVLEAEEGTSREALAALQHLNERETAEGLRGLIDDERAMIRRRATKGFIQTLSGRLPELVRLLEQPDADIYMLLYYRFKDDPWSGIPALIQGLNDPHPLVRDRSARLLLEFAKPEQVDAVEALNRYAPYNARTSP